MDVEFLDKWQTLIGSALGPFLAIIASVLGYALKEIYTKYKKRRESYRVTEICISQTINHTLTLIDQIDGFLDRVRGIIEEIGKMPKGSRALQITNYPPIIEVYFNDEISRMKLYSYYLHNKILIVEYIVRWTNSTFPQFKEDFKELLRRNEYIADKEKISADEQREGFARNLTSFAEMVEGVVSKLKTDHLRVMMQTKVYNRKMLKNYRKTHQEFEDTGCMFCKEEQDLNDLDRIDKLIEEDVAKLIEQTEERTQKK